MPRISFWRRERNDFDDSVSPSIRPAATASSTVPIRDAERRRLSRLLARRSNIEYDLSQAESAFMPQNRWTERVEQLDNAIAQANEDLARLAPSPVTTSPVRLPSQPIVTEVRSTEVPAEIAIRAGNEVLLFREELDWSERGHQLAQPKLTQVSGNIASFTPEHLDPDTRQRLDSHLTNSFSVIADDSLKRALAGEPLLELTLDRLTVPCDRCGGWLDPLGRCPACVEIDWRRHEIAAAAARLVDERSGVCADQERVRERLPVFRRQLQDVERDILELRAKGVEPD